MPKQNDVHCKFNAEMFKMLVSGKEVIVEQADGSRWYFVLDDIEPAQMLRAVADVLEREKINDYSGVDNKS